MGPRPGASEFCDDDDERQRLLELHGHEPGKLHKIAVNSLCIMPHPITLDFAAVGIPIVGSTNEEAANNLSDLDLVTIMEMQRQQPGEMPEASGLVHIVGGYCLITTIDSTGITQPLPIGGLTPLTPSSSQS